MIDNQKAFLHIPDTASYVQAGLDSGEFTVHTYVKSARIHAEPGNPGEGIVTVLKNGLEETENTVGVDAETGMPDWIVTAPAGERYIVTDAVFREKYKPAPDEPGVFIPVGKPVRAVQIHENIRFTAPWREEQRLLAGGFLILDPGGIYGVAEEEFSKTYRLADQDGEYQNNL